MPYSKKRKIPPKGNYNQKRKYPKRNVKKSSTFVRLPGFGYPDKIQTKLTYADHKTMTSGTGSLAIQQFRANSIYDPDYTDTGHQPLYFDEYAVLYNRYRVRGIAYEVDVVGVTSSVPGVLCVYGSQTADTESSIYYAIELGKASQTINSGNEGQNRSKIKGYFSIASLFGLKDLGQEINYVSDFGNNPSQAAFLTILWQAANGGSTTAANVTVKLTYYVDCYSKKIVTPSFSLEDKEKKIMEEIKKFQLEKDKANKQKFVPSSPMREN